MSDSKHLENWAKFMWDKGIDKKPGKGEFNACGMFVLLPIVENLESSEMFGEAAKSSPPRVQIFHQTYLSLCLSFLLQKHPMNSPFTEFLFLGLGLY